VLVATSPQLDGIGGYFQDCHQAPGRDPGTAYITIYGVAAYAIGPAIANRLWEIPLQLLRSRDSQRRRAASRPRGHVMTPGHPSPSPASASRQRASSGLRRHVPGPRRPDSAGSYRRETLAVAAVALLALVAVILYDAFAGQF